MTWHFGRSWTGTPLEDICPCGKAPCGLVDEALVDEECLQHPFSRTKTIRQMHQAENCPAPSY